MSSTWEILGFKQSPFESKPLAVNDLGISLFTGRETQAEDFYTQVESAANGGVIVVSGCGGVGKTSFVNVCQHRLATGNCRLKIAIAPCYNPTSLAVNPDPDPVCLARSIAQNSIYNAIKNLEIKNKGIPKELVELEDWVKHSKKKSGESYGLGLFSMGQSYSFPPVESANIETWANVLSLVQCLLKKSNVFDGFFVTLDNSEQIDIDLLAKLFMAFRDTLFSVEAVWWILVGESKLYWKLAGKKEGRISERISGCGIEIPPMSKDEIRDLVEKRIIEFKSDNKAVYPLSNRIHQLIYSASRGVARYVLDKSATVIEKFVSIMRQDISKSMQGKAGPKVIDKNVDIVLKEKTFSKEIDDMFLKKILWTHATEYVTNQNFSKQNMQILTKIGSGELPLTDINDITSIHELRNALEIQERDGVKVCRLKGDCYLFAALSESGSPDERSS